MKKFFAYTFTGIAAVAAVVDGCLLFLKPNDTSQSQSAVVSKKSSNATGVNTSSNNGSSDLTTTDKNTSSSNNSTASITNSTLKDGTYTGASTPTEWGDVQLQITVESGKLSTIKVLSYPNTHGHSVMINEQALPIYKEEAIASQSADIQQISGATETFQGFTGSLQDALAQAQSGQASDGANT